MKKFLMILAISVVFGLLMSFRDTLSDLWMRALVAGVAFALLGVLISHYHRPKASTKHSE
jgi:hypothetical protein